MVHGRTTDIPVTDSTMRFARVAITGRLATVNRAEFTAMVAAAGGECCPNVTRRTSVLVVGMNGWPLRADGRPSRMIERAEALNAQGCRIRIIAEIPFLEELGSRPRAAETSKTLEAAQVCAAIGIDAPTLRRWEFAGLIRSDDGRYDFQDVVSLRTIAALVQGGASPKQIAGGVRALSRILPDTERPLSQLTIVVEDATGELVAELGDAFLSPDGQYLINFSAEPDFEGEAVDHLETSAHATVRARFKFDHHPLAESADELFTRARALEDAERFSDAEAAYRRAIVLRADFPEAYFNLGNVLRNVARIEDAADAYRTAIELEPELAPAWFNLADLYDEMDQPREAVDCLKHAIEVDPTYADAHYNLACCLERIGDTPAAAQAWLRYLKLDRTSHWADIAREHLSAIVRDA